MENDDSAVQYAIGRSETVAPGVGIDLEFDADVQTMSPEASEYETCYVTSHKGPCRVATYSRDGQLIATGSADASIKILDTERMLAKSAMPLEVSAWMSWFSSRVISFLNACYRSYFEQFIQTYFTFFLKIASTFTHTFATSDAEPSSCPTFIFFPFLIMFHLDVLHNSEEKNQFHGDFNIM